MMDATAKKNTGSFYTCNSIADFIADWAIDTPEICVLEPSFGDGIFIDSAFSKYEELRTQNPKIIGIEIQEQPFKQFMKSHAGVQGFHMDFMDYRANTIINAVIGNPPYISLKNLKKEEREKALQLVSSYGIKMQTSGSLWMPFIIHSTELLGQGGKLGFWLSVLISKIQDIG